ncbi:MAG TPA: cytochrome c biogenesis protein CcsA [Chitinophagaceae bacterium]|nr:cytochrome c biogenesis protein CcsA [Chitinophagaceae bacterium]
MDTQFLNEHLLPGKIGELFTIISFAASLIAAISYFLSAQSKVDETHSSWKKLARSSFFIHSFSVFGIFVTLFYLIFNHYFEYNYVWTHSSKALPFKYLLSCFWEGQEGSFLLWSTWNCFLSFFIIYKKGKWEAPVMTMVSLTQVVLSTMLLGLYFFGEKIGSNPFTLLRDQMVGAPIFQQPNYLASILDGNGLNPLLQNYWMVIHPPILFLGFASTLFPFALVVAIMWKNDYEDFILPLLKWSLFSCMILGTGIMMGGAWAYESLNFGGYWAWDPVENASLVPWITMLAGLHTLMIYKATGYSLKSTILFFIISFALVLYSTFLTRTGILGETSVHAFTGEGSSLFYHLLIFLFLFFIIGLFLFFKNYKKIPDLKKEEEALSSREFWMFIGSLVLMISVVQITYTTSMPVWNKMFGTKLAITNPIDHYNKIQIWITLLVLLGTATIYYFKFKESNMMEIAKRIAIPLVLSLIVGGLITYFQSLKSIPVAALMFATLFSVFANLMFIVRTLKWNAIKWGGSTAHIGFALMVVGIILSSYNKEVISVNRLGVDFEMGKKTEEENKKESRENLLLFKNMPVTMAGYTLTYVGDTVEGPNHYFRIKYQTRQDDTGRIKEEFILAPNAQINPKMGLISSPDTKHYLTHDIFTYITSTVDKSKMKDTVSYTSQKMKKGDTAFFASGYMIFEGFNTEVNSKNYIAQTGDIAVSAKLQVYNLEGLATPTSPIYIIRNQQEEMIEDTLSSYNLYTRLSKIIPDENAAVIEFKQPSAMNDYVIMKAILFPYINVLWLGTVIMILGFLISLYKRIKTK